tara:strand:+ start:1762 stop:3654 length:1893 start_codon:yes stop_codon:yes gene_type:complete
MIIEVAHFLLILCTGLFLMSCCFSLLNKNESYTHILVSRTYSHACLFLFVSFAIFIWLSISDNFNVMYIASHSNSNLPIFYKITSIWSAHEGSMYLWIVFLALWGFIFNLYEFSFKAFKSISISIISFVLVGFLTFLLLTSNPYETILPIAPINGADINPVLQDPALAIHPPTLYLGYVGFVIPFACALAFLIIGDPTIKWEAIIKKWAFAAWVFLTVGITLGSWWAYYELGWGGYWFWDPVENVALMPWLAATAFIHSIHVSIKTSKLRVWSILLSILVFSLSLFGAFIVRSGIIDSVHSFANDPQRGLYLLAFIAVIISISLFVFSYRFSIFSSKKSIESLSKESFISLNNIIFGSLIFSVMLGVIYPLVYEYLFNQKISVGAPYYNAIFIPIVILASIFLFFSIESRWQRTLKFINKKLYILISLTFAILLTFAVSFMFNTNNLYILASIFSGLLIILRYFLVLFDTVFFKSFVNPFSVLAHLGLGLLLISISFNSLLSTERALSIKLGEFETYKNYKISFDDIQVLKNSNHDAIKGSFTFEDLDGSSFKLNPEKRRYFTRGQITTETAIHITPIKDIYITIGDQLDDKSWVVNIQINYFIRYIWISAILMSLSGILLLFNAQKEKF